LTPFRNVFLDSSPQMFLLTCLWQMFLLNSVFSAPYYITVGSAVIQFKGGGGASYNLSCISVAFAPFNLLSSVYLLTWGLGFFLCLWTGVFLFQCTLLTGVFHLCAVWLGFLCIFWHCPAMYLLTQGLGFSSYLLTLFCSVPFNLWTGVSLYLLTLFPAI